MTPRNGRSGIDTPGATSILFLRTSIYAFSGMLAVFLTGIALGSLLLRRRVDRLRTPLVAFAALEVVVGVLSVVNLYLFAPLDGELARSVLGIARVGIATMVIVLPLTLLFGMITPVACVCYTESADAAGASIGRLYSANTVGSILGSLAAGFLLIPLLGATQAVLVLALVNVVLGVALFQAESRRTHARRWTYAIAGIPLVLLLIAASYPTDPFRATIERRIDARIGTSWIPGAYLALPKSHKVYYHHEGVEGTLTAFEVNRFKQLWINGVGMTFLNTETKGMAYLPLFFAKQPKQFLAIAFGMGTSTRSAAVAQAAGLYPDLEITGIAELDFVLGGGIVAGTVFYVMGRRVERRVAEATARLMAGERERQLADARARVELEAREELVRAREQLEQDLAERRREVDRRLTALEKTQSATAEREREIARREQSFTERDRALAGREQEARAQLERLAGLSAQDAKEELKRRLEEEARGEAAALLRDIREQAQKSADREAKKIVALAIQRIAADHTAETTASAVALPSDEMKGRIIGREGRNIRAFEAATGTDVIIDDTPDTVVISCFDPVRREVARLSLERLISDGRIHPGRIEEVVRKAQEEIEAGIVEAGERAVYETGLRGMHQELVKLVGRMRYRTSYGQNILEHSKEVAWMAGIMAAELKLDVPLAKRGGLLHDIGKVLTHEHDGTHVQLGVEVATKYGEHPVVINCIAAHHDDVPHDSAISVIVQAADAVSGSRPGARREAFETYVKRLTAIEQIAAEFSGVEKVYAIQAGREVRVVVAPGAVDDTKATGLAEQISRKIERELQYPGQIKVVVIRETRAVDFAR